jgi:hypothetical protein
MGSFRCDIIRLRYQDISSCSLIVQPRNDETIHAVQAIEQSMTGSIIGKEGGIIGDTFTEPLGGIRNIVHLAAPTTIATPGV